MTTTDTTTARQYVIAFDYGDGLGYAIDTAARMVRAVEDAAYSGEADSARYFTMLGGTLTEVTFRAIPGSHHADEDDYLYTRYGVYRLTDGPDAAPFDTFTVRIDGRV